MAGEQLARDRWSRDRLLAHQAERLRALIAHAVAASPYYRDLLGPDAAGGDVPLSELPTLPKATLMDDFDRIVTDPRLRRAELAAHLSGPAAELLEVRQYQVVHDPAGLHVAVVLREGVPADTRPGSGPPWPSSSTTPAPSRRRSRSPRWPSSAATPATGPSSS